MAQHPDVRRTGERIEAILASLSGTPAQAASDELVRLLVELYGTGLARVMELLASDEAADPGTLARLVDDPLVESLLLVHDLHPVDVDTRIQRALDRVRPYLGSHAGGVVYEGVDAAGVAHLTLSGSCHGCPSSAVTVKLTIEGALQDAAPEVTAVEVVGLVEPAAPGPLLQIGRRPPSTVELHAAPGPCPVPVPHG